MNEQNSTSLKPLSEIIASFKSNLKSANGEIIENFADFLDSIKLIETADKKAAIFETREPMLDNINGFNANDMLQELKNNELNVLYADELYESGNYRETVFEKCVLSVTFPILGIADTGTIVENNPIRSLSILPPVHLALLNQENIMPDLKTALEKLTEIFTNETGEILLPPAITFITGPSRTADIEQTLTVGVHGPIRQAVIILNQ